MKFSLVKKILLLTLVTFVLTEVIIRTLNLTNDIPNRKIDINGLQNYILDQKGIYRDNNWVVNNDGFLGLNDKKFKNQILIIGDSMIENIMNPIECNQGYLIKENLDNSYGVFEIGRSGITLIEAFQFEKNYRKIVEPSVSLIYVNKGDIIESISNISKLSDRLQIDVDSKEIQEVKIKFPLLKKILYNFKTLYFLYIRGFFQIDFKTKSNIIEEKNKNQNLINKFIEIINFNYDLSKVILVTDINNLNLINSLKKIKVKKIITFNPDKNWYVKNDDHWNCFGHRMVSKKIIDYFNE